MTEVKFCKDCKHNCLSATYSHPSNPEDFEWDMLICKKQYLDVVSGEEFPGKFDCKTARECEIYCGREAKYFEPRGNHD